MQQTVTLTEIELAAAAGRSVAEIRSLADSGKIAVIHTLPDGLRVFSRNVLNFVRSNPHANERATIVRGNIGRPGEIETRYFTN